MTSVVPYRLTGVLCLQAKILPEKLIKRVIMVYCVAFNCNTKSGQGFGLFEFPKDEKRRKAWTIRVKRKDFVPSKTSRLCSKHFTNDQFVVNPALALKIGHKPQGLESLS